MTRRLTILELNEFNDGLLHEAAEVMDVPHLRRMLALRRTTTTTTDIYADGSLEPWVQWVSTHTGVPYREHGIRHIGDVPEGLPQLWEQLSDRGVTSGVWGVLNAVRHDTAHCLFFVPDPWTFEEWAWPRSLDGLIALPRFLAKNRLNPFQPDLVRLGARLARTFAHPRHAAAAVRQLPRMAPQLLRDADKAFVYFTAFEYLSAVRFTEAKRHHDPQLSMLFVNMLAHAQHYWWDPTDLRDNPRMQYVLRYVDRVIGRVFEALHPDEELVVLNGFEQFNMADHPAHHVYRQRDHHRFIHDRLGGRVTLVDAHMTNDAHIVCPTAADLKHVLAGLRTVTVRGEPMFRIETYPDDARKAFYQVRFGAPLPPDATYTIGDRSLPFWDDFESLGTHTGRHGPEGQVYSTLRNLEDSIPNHRVLGAVAAHFGQADWPAGSGTAAVRLSTASK